MKKYSSIFCLFLFALTFYNCKKEDLPEETPKCIQNKIDDIDKEIFQGRQVWRWQSGDEAYYYITSGCCDMFDFLYDENCMEICAPTGGFSGAGDGQCPEFDPPMVETLIWEQTE